MSTARTKTSDRQQALQLLQAAFGTTDGSMVFTYHGDVYKTLGTNADATLQLQNVTTGQITGSVDPLDIYDAALAASGETPAFIPPKVQTSKKGPSLATKVISYAGTVSSTINLVSQIKPIAKLLAKIPGFTAGVGVFSIGLSVVGLFQGIDKIFSKGGFSVGGLISLGTAFFGLGTGINLILGLSLLGPAGWGFAGAILIGILAIEGIKKLIGALFHHDTHTEAMRDLTKTITPIIWTAGPLLFIAAGTTALLMGIPKSAKNPIMSSITVPQSFVTSAVGHEVPMSASKTPTILVEHGNGKDQPGRVTVVTPQGVDSQGTPMLRLKSYLLDRDLDFVSSEAVPYNSYIPFFIYRGKKAIPNPACTEALARQDALLKSILSGGLDAQEAMSAMRLAMASDKHGVSPTN